MNCYSAIEIKSAFLKITETPCLKKTTSFVYLFQKVNEKEKFKIEDGQKYYVGSSE